MQRIGVKPPHELRDQICSTQAHYIEMTIKLTLFQIPRKNRLLLFFFRSEQSDDFIGPHAKI